MSIQFIPISFLQRKWATFEHLNATFAFPSHVSLPFLPLFSSATSATDQARWNTCECLLSSSTTLKNYVIFILTSTPSSSITMLSLFFLRRFFLRSLTLSMADSINGRGANILCERVWFSLPREKMERIPLALVLFLLGISVPIDASGLYCKQVDPGYGKISSTYFPFRVYFVIFW